MSDFIFRVSPNIILGSYTVSRLGQHAREWGTRYMVILDPILNEAKMPEKIVQTLKDRNIECICFAELTDGTSTKTIMRALTLAREAHVHGIIAIGGSKTLSIGRAVAAFYNEAHDFYTFVDGAVPTTNALPCICVPTTYRMPTVFTSDIPVTDSRSHQLRILKVQNTVCRLLLVDPNLMLTLTETQKSTLSIELLALGVEAYISQKANFFSDMFVEKGLEILSYALDGSPSLEVTTPEEILLGQAGCMLSVASASASMGLGSLISLSVYSRYKLNKSLVNAILLPYQMEDTLRYKAAKLQKIAQIMHIGIPDAEADEDARTLVEYVRQKIAKANLPTRLKDLKLTIDQLSLAVEDVSQKYLVNCMPRSMTADDLFDFVKVAY